MIAIVDYGMGNLRSVEKALAAVGGDPVVTADPEVVAGAARVVLPGVGAFSAAMRNLAGRGLEEAVTGAIAAGKPFLGICLGLQLLFESSEEMGETRGLGLLPGRVVRFPAGCTSAGTEGIKVPHIGWNELHYTRPSRLLRGLPDGARVYFVHSYYPVPAEQDQVIATSEYGGRFCCAIERENVSAVQFHPEKSGVVGLQILRNFVC